MHSVRVPAIVGLVLLNTGFGCATVSRFVDREPPQIDMAELAREADAALDYVEGKSESLPATVAHIAAPNAPHDELLSRIDERGAAMRARADEIAALKARGVLGEDNRGYLVLHDDELLEGPDEKNAVQKVMASENDDRKAFYRAIARAREDAGLTLTRVERVFAARRLARAGSGAVVQLPPDGDEFAKLKETPLAAALGESFRPGGWINVP